MVAATKVGSLEWTEPLELYEEPHGEERFVIDRSSGAAVSFSLDGIAPGEVTAALPNPAEVIRAIKSTGWTSEYLYRAPPERLVELCRDPR